MNAQKQVSGGHTSLFVGNLDPSVTDVICRKYGRVLMSHVVIDRVGAICFRVRS